MRQGERRDLWLAKIGADSALKTARLMTMTEPSQDAQAVEMVKAGPVMPNSIEMWLAPALAMVFGIVSGWTRLVPFL